MASKNTALALAVTAALAAVAGPAAAGGASKPDDAPSAAQLQKVRQATARYRDVKKALADGFVATKDCEEGMGFHYIHPRRATDRKVDVTKPEFLLYGPKRGGGVELLGVEYYVADSDDAVATRDRDLPRPLGRAFDGPMPGHVPGMPVHNDLHVWLFVKNPKGRFTPNNPRVTCY
jgi:hypothetical protein